LKHFGMILKLKSSNRLPVVPGIILKIIFE